MEARIYLAGKMSGWRKSIVRDLDKVPVENHWPMLERAIFGKHSYTGPFPNMPDQVWDRAQKAIQRSDLVFAWIDTLDAYGTLVEIGYAFAQGRRIVVATPERMPDLWLVYETASQILHTDNPREALREAMDDGPEARSDELNDIWRAKLALDEFICTGTISSYPNAYLAGISNRLHDLVSKALDK